MKSIDFDIMRQAREVESKIKFNPYRQKLYTVAKAVVNRVPGMPKAKAFREAAKLHGVWEDADSHSVIFDMIREMKN